MGQTGDSSILHKHETPQQIQILLLCDNKKLMRTIELHLRQYKLFSHLVGDADDLKARMLARMQGCSLAIIGNSAVVDGSWATAVEKLPNNGDIASPPILMVASQPIKSKYKNLQLMDFPFNAGEFLRVVEELLDEEKEGT